MKTIATKAKSKTVLRMLLDMGKSNYNYELKFIKFKFKILLRVQILWDSINLFLRDFIDQSNKFY